MSTNTHGHARTRIAHMHAHANRLTLWARPAPLEPQLVDRIRSESAVARMGRAVCLFAALFSIYALFVSLDIQVVFGALRVRLLRLSWFVLCPSCVAFPFQVQRKLKTVEVRCEAHAGGTSPNQPAHS